MILTDSHGIRRDLGPGSGIGQNSVRFVNVPGFHIEEPFNLDLRCPTCAEPIPAGRIACTAHARRVWGRMVTAR